MTVRKLILSTLSVIVIVGYWALLHSEAWLDKIISLFPDYLGLVFFPFSFFIFFAAFACLIKVFIDLFVPNRMTELTATHWAAVRSKGKRRYILECLAIAGAPLVISLVLAFASSDYSAESMGKFFVLGLVAIGGLLAIVYVSWNQQESIYQRWKDSQTFTHDANSNQ